MATFTDNDLREIKDLINNRFDTLKDDIQSIDKKLEVYIAKTAEKLDSINQSLVELKKQSEKQDNRLWVLISGMFLALLGIIAKFALNP